LSKDDATEEVDGATPAADAADAADVVTDWDAPPW
jgi:hypothetical protein